MRGFSLVELLVVLAVATLLTGLMMPAMVGIRENANRVVCAANERSLLTGLFSYLNENSDELPTSRALKSSEDNPRELMRIHHGERTIRWDGFGRIFAMQYCEAPDCFFCPSHHGEHGVDRYAEEMYARRGARENLPAGEPIYMNYHYSGQREWHENTPRRIIDGHDFVVLTDGFRTLSDVNHRTGMNVARADGSVQWEDLRRGFLEVVAADPGDDDDGLAHSAASFKYLWLQIEDPK